MPQRQHSPQRETRNHFLVFCFGAKLSPLMLNDPSNSFEVYTLNSTSEFADCFQSQRPGCLVTDAAVDFFSYPSPNLMSRLMPVVMVTHSSSIRAAAAASRHGAHSVLRDFTSQDHVRDAIRSACFADFKGPYSPHDLRCRIERLTSKERQVIYMSIRGKTTKTISSELGVCHQTVDKHKKRALSKMNCSSVVEFLNVLLESHHVVSGRMPSSAAVRAPHFPSATATFG